MYAPAHWPQLRCVCRTRSQLARDAVEAPRASHSSYPSFQAEPSLSWLGRQFSSSRHIPPAARGLGSRPLASFITGGALDAFAPRVAGRAHTRWGEASSICVAHCCVLSAVALEGLH